MQNDSGAFFKLTDPKIDEIAGFPLLPSWWSRGYEYAWASQFTDPKFVVADMGAGWSGRPFKEHLADTCRLVYAVDLDRRLLDLENTRSNMEFIIGDFTQSIALEPLDRIFCISVLEDLVNYDAAMREFYRLLKPGGLLVITCDSQFDPDKPLPRYPGVSFPRLFNAIQDAGFEVPDLDLNKDDAVVNTDWNLACYHMALVK